jgi:DNA-directed RNA polymerase specialized sigma24 family protein
MDDQELLYRFVRTGDQDAFALIVARYVRTVYAWARLRVNDAHLAKDIAQTVFILLARKARTINGGKIQGDGLVRAARTVRRRRR